MNHYKKFTLGLIVALLTVAYAEKRPNIIFILADDMGIGDMSHNGGVVPTPYLDQMAREGLSFQDAHTSSSVCTPSRYSLLTGRYAWRTRLPMAVFNTPDFTPLIKDDETTVASLLKAQGYQTGLVGKWHLGFQWQYNPDYVLEKGHIGEGWDIDYSKPIVRSPVDCGFDYYWGIMSSLDMPPYLYVHNRQALCEELVPKVGFYGRDGVMDSKFKADECLLNFAEKAVKYIDDAQEKKDPFFLYLSLTSPHTPIVPSARWKGKSSLGDFGAFVMETDWVVGEVMKKLDELGITEETMLIFSTDNGTSPGQVKKWKEKGHYCNGTLRGAKADIYEGGHRVPFIVRWPQVVAPGAETHRLTCLSDFFATCAELTDYKMTAAEGVDSVSFLQTLKDPTRIERSPVVHHSYKGAFGIRAGQWKLNLCSGSGGFDSPVEGAAPVQLYDLSSDLSERHNLEAQYPQKVRELQALLQSYVDAGRSTPGEPQKNDRESIDIGPNPVVEKITQ